jgi:phosphatidylserine/phosphatidylglycerophosphate/cardiolipin synthase-like enzyme
MDAVRGMSPHQVMVLDGEFILTGRFNCTKAAQEKNAGNVLIIHDPALAAHYAKNWDAHQRHCQPSVG